MHDMSYKIYGCHCNSVISNCIGNPLDLGKYITFNPDYVLKPDDGRTLIMASLVGRNLLKGVEDTFTNIIHPIYAMILSFVNGREYHECVADASNELGVSEDLVERFIESLKDNPNQVYLKSKDGVSVFPPRTIVSVTERSYSNRYTPSLFDYEKVDLCLKRHLTPSVITIMFNNVCVTDCIYCYQDKTRIANCGIPLKRIIELIHEAYDLRVNTIDVIGGEFFLYKHWREVLYELRKLGYNPYLSTKMPLTEEDVKYLSDLRIYDIQLSIDTLLEAHLTESIGVKKGYVDKLLESIGFLDKYGIPIMVHSVLTRYSGSAEDMQSVYEALKKLKHLKDWHIVKGDASLYPKTDYSDIEISPSALNDVVDYLDGIAKESGLAIRFPQKAGPGNAVAMDFNEIKDRTRTFFNRNFCSGLFSSLYILPDGKVTMCEQLYWNNRFIVGDVTKNSLNEIWNSAEAKSIYYIKQEDIPADSLCHSCNKFDACRSLRQVCYREIIRKYGSDKWYFPDVNCPYVELQTED